MVETFRRCLQLCMANNLHYNYYTTVVLCRAIKWQIETVQTVQHDQLYGSRVYVQTHFRINDSLDEKFMKCFFIITMIIVTVI